MRVHIALLIAVVFAASSCGKNDEKPPAPRTSESTPAPASSLIGESDRALFGQLPAHMRGDATHSDALIALGRQLYFDTRLSKNQDISCNSCHQLDRFGVDGEPTSPGHEGARGTRNSPTVYNAAAHAMQFWDGRAKDVEEQAKGPVLNPIEMGMPGEDAVVDVLKSIPGYETQFAAVFPGADAPITYDNMAIAIGAFERGLVTPDRFDAYLAGDAEALTATEQRGLRTFIDTGCTTCHSGAYLGGDAFQKLGMITPWPNQNDQGRFEATKVDADKMMFKVPSLRNIAETGPYFHDGSVADLAEAVRMMAKHQLGKTLTDAETASILAFLKALTGTPPADYIAKPALPPSGPDTPQPNKG